MITVDNNDFVWIVIDELIKLFRKHNINHLLVGGWIPTILFPNAGHIGSRDIDIMLDSESFDHTSHVNLKASLTKMGYRVDHEHNFIYYKNVRIENSDFDVKVNFLSGNYRGKTIPRTESIGKIKTIKIKHGWFAFECEPVTKTIELNQQTKVHCFLVNIVPYFTMKAVAAKDREEHKTKDLYDLYFCLDHFRDDLPSFVNQFKPHMNKTPVLEMIDILTSYFITTKEGVNDVVATTDVIDDEISLRTNVEMIFTTFIEMLNSL